MVHGLLRLANSISSSMSFWFNFGYFCLTFDLSLAAHKALLTVSNNYSHLASPVQVFGNTRHTIISSLCSNFVTYSYVHMRALVVYHNS